MWFPAHCFCFRPNLLKRDPLVVLSGNTLRVTFPDIGPDQHHWPCSNLTAVSHPQDDERDTNTPSSEGGGQACESSRLQGPSVCWRHVKHAATRLAEARRTLEGRLGATNHQPDRLRECQLTVQITSQGQAGRAWLRHKPDRGLRNGTLEITAFTNMR